ncbi:MAG: type II secretion system F family protein, partial [Pseudomonadota bacterium]
MPKFAYRAISEDGRPESGVIEADTLESAQNALFARGYIPSKVSPKGGASLLESPLAGLISPIKTRDIIIFTKQLSTMIRAGVPILRMFQILGEQTENRRLKKTIEAISGTVKEGASLYNAFNKHPKVFSELYCSMLQAGEESGSLPEVLDRLTYIIEHEEKVKSEIKSALTYPAIVFVFLIGAFFFLLGFVVPRFVSLFKRTKIELPLPTKITILMHDILINYWYLLLGGLILIIVVLVLYMRTQQGKYHRDLLLLKVPLIGPLLVKAAMSRFASICAICQSSGI